MLNLRISGSIIFAFLTAITNLTLAICDTDNWHNAFQELKDFFKIETERLKFEQEQMEKRHASEIQRIAENAGKGERILRREIMKLKLRLQEVARTCSKKFSMLEKDVCLCTTDSDQQNRENAKDGQTVPSALRTPKDMALSWNYQKSKRSFPHSSEPEANVAFFANLPVTIEITGTYENIVFNNTVTNIGNAYNSSDGVFSAPVDGVYVFMVTLTRYRERSWAYVLHNDITVAKLNFFNVEEQSSQTVILDLKKGDHVTVKNTIAQRGFGGDLDSTFAGFLLYKHSK